MRSVQRLGLWLVAGAAVTLAVGLVAAPDRAAANLLLAGWALAGAGLAGAFFVALTYVADATWAIAFRRVPEAMTGAFPAAAVVLALVFVLRPSLYPWTIEPVGAPGSFTQLWLSVPFFVLRAAIYFAAWMLFASLLVRNSRRQDADGDLIWTRRNARVSAAFLVVFALTCFLASVDWIMSLTPHWYSTMFGVYNFAGLFQSGLAVIVLLVIWQRQSGPLRHAVNDEHLHDLGKLLFAFGTFWMYIWFCQFMLIWYANISEETAYFVPRMRGAWFPLVLLDVALNWVVPFVAIMNRPFKRRASVLARVAVAMLVGRWLDLYLMILPSVSPDAPPFGLWELAGALLVCGAFVSTWAGRFAKAAPVPDRDPFLSESLHYHS